MALSTLAFLVSFVARSPAPFSGGPTKGAQQAQFYIPHKCRTNKLQCNPPAKPTSPQENQSVLQHKCVTAELADYLINFFAAFLYFFLKKRAQGRLLTAVSISAASSMKKGLPGAFAIS